MSDIAPITDREREIIAAKLDRYNRVDADEKWLIRAYEARLSAAEAEIERLKAGDWIAVEDRMPPPRMHVLCYNRDGYIFEGCVCYGLHRPWFTYPRGDGNASNTAPDWIDVTHWMPKPAPPAALSKENE